jgi:hypothetical protein
MEVGLSNLRRFNTRQWQRASWDELNSRCRVAVAALADGDHALGAIDSVAIQHTHERSRVELSRRCCISFSARHDGDRALGGCRICGSSTHASIRGTAAVAAAPATWADWPGIVLCYMKWNESKFIVLIKGGCDRATVPTMNRREGVLVKDDHFTCARVGTFQCSHQYPSSPRHSRR